MFSSTENRSPTGNVRRTIGAQQVTGGAHVDHVGGAASASKTIVKGGVRFREQGIDHKSELASVVFTTVVNDKVKLAAHLNNRFAIVQIAEGQKYCLILADKELVNESDIEAVAELIKRSGKELPESGIQGYFASTAIVISLAQGTLRPDQLQFDRSMRSDRSQSSHMAHFTQIVAWAFENNASDLDFVVDNYSTDSYVAFKVAGKYIKPQSYHLPTGTINQMLGAVWQRSNGGAEGSFVHNMEQQCKVDLDIPKSSTLPEGASVRLRWSSLPTDRGTVVTMRLQRLGGNALISNLEEAGYLQSQIEVLDRIALSRGGLRLWSGEVGSGKSTSIAMQMKRLPHDWKIISIEDPVEIDVPNAHQRTVTRDLSATGDDKSFAAVARGVFRSALDVLYLGEIRDPETGLVARQIGDSGMSVFTTVHARSALGIVDRLCSPAIGIPRDVLASPGMLRVLVFQALLPVTCPHCGRSPADHAAGMNLHGADLEQHNDYFARIERLYKVDSSRFRLVNPDGCSHCRKEDLPELNGMIDRTVVAEIVELDDTMLEFILAGDGVSLQRYWRSLSNGDFLSEDMTGKNAMECGIYKAAQGVVDPRLIERQFTSFRTIEAQQRAQKA